MITSINEWRKHLEDKKSDKDDKIRNANHKDDKTAQPAVAQAQPTAQPIAKPAAAPVTTAPPAQPVAKAPGASSGDTSGASSGEDDKHNHDNIRKADSVIANNKAMLGEAIDSPSIIWNDFSSHERLNVLKSMHLDTKYTDVDYEHLPKDIESKLYKELSKDVYQTNESVIKNEGKYTVDKAIKDYTAELESGKEWKADGKKTVSDRTAGEELAKDRKEVPIDEYIAYWEKGLKKLKVMKAKGETDAEKFYY